jgi:hypothetical protein
MLWHMVLGTVQSINSESRLRESVASVHITTA